MPQQQRYNSTQIVNQSIDQQNTGEISFENNILQRNCQGDYSAILNYQSDTSKNNIKNQDLFFHPKSQEYLEKGKQLLKSKQITEAIEQNLSKFTIIRAFKQSVQLENGLLDGHYFLAISYLGTQQYQKAINQFLNVLNQDPKYRKNIYLLLAISYKKINQIDQSILTVIHIYSHIPIKLSKVIHLHPRYYDAYIYRGKLYLKSKLIDKALSDFSISIQLNPNKGLGYLGKADCQRYLTHFNEAIQLYSKAISIEQQLSSAAVLKKAITYYENRQYNESLDDLNKLLQIDQNNSEAYYFKGLCKLKLTSPQEALLSFEQAIKHNNSKKAVTKSLYEISKIKIDQRDFYAAYHTLNRSEFLDIENNYLDKFKLFTEGVIFLMKRKFKESIENFSQIEQNHTLNDYLKPLFYTYRAFGYFCLSEHEKALADYKQLDNGSEQSIAYNSLLCEGILKVQKGKFSEGMEMFKMASKIYPKKAEPNFYIGVTLIKQQKINQGLAIIDQIPHENANLYYIRAIINGSLGNNEQAISDVEKAIEKSEDNVPKYFFFRGMIYGCSKQYKQAANDFSICLNLDQNFDEAYLERAKCEFMYGDSTQAFSDLQKYIQLQPENPKIHVWAGNFLFANGAIEDAIKAYSHAPQLNGELIRQVCSCYMVLGELDKCIEYVIKLGWKFDQECLESLQVVFTSDIYFNDDKEQLLLQKKLSQGLTKINQLIISKQQGQMFKQYHLLIFKGVYLFHQQKYEDAFQCFSLAQSQKEIEITEKNIKGMEVSEEEEDADLLEILEIKFNELASLLMIRQFKKAKERCRQLIENINESKQEGLQYLMVQLDNEIRKNEGRQFDELIGYDKVICLYDEPKENPICFQVPIVFVDYMDDLKIRLSFSLPKITPPNLQIKYDQQLMDNIGPLAIENKPEAPWIRREKQNEMIMFTDNIQMFDDIRLETEEAQEEQSSNSKKSKNQINLEIENKEDFKNQLKLDKNIEEKLQKLLEKRKQQK